MEKQQDITPSNAAVLNPDFNPVKWLVIGAVGGILFNVLTAQEGEAQKQKGHE